MASELETLDSLLNKATNPANHDEDWDHMMMFCDRVNKDIEGPMISVRLLAHKLQSPQEREALFALLTLETCVKNCGSRFQSEIGKFRFLNEIIKVVSPKYLGTRTSENVKKRCIELMYSWTRDLSHEPKIGEAYAMLKTQGIVKEDPAYIDKNLNANPVPPPRPKNALFEDDEKARLLSRLLKSKNPEDLQAANRLIKNMVQQDADRIDKISKRVSELETINNNVSVLSEMLEHYGTESASQSDRDTMKELYETLEKLRPNLFRLASDTDEQDNDGIADILKANDEVMKVMNQYKLKVEGSSDFGTNHTLLDLGFDQTTQSPNKMKSNLASTTTLVGASILDEQLLALGLSDPPDMKPVVASTQQSSIVDNSSTIDQLSDIFGSVNVEPSDKLSNVIKANSTTDATPSPIHSVFNMGATSTPLNSGMVPSTVFPSFPVTSQTPTLASGSFVAAPSKNKPQVFGSMAPDAHSLRMSSSTAVSESQKKAMEELDMLGKAMLMQSLSKEKGQSSSSTNSTFTSALAVTGANTTTTTTTTTTTATATATTTATAIASSLSTTSSAAHSTNSVIGPFIGAATTTTATTTTTNNTTLSDTIGDLFCFNGDLTPSILTTTSAPASTISTTDVADILTATAATKSALHVTTASTTTAATTAAAAAAINSSGGDDGGDVVGSLLNFSTKPLVPVGQEPAYSDGGGSIINTGSPTLVQKEPISLSDVFVPLESVEPGTTPSIHAYEKDSLKIVIHFAKNKPRPDVLVLVVSVMNSGLIPIRNFLFQAAVPKMMKVKLQPPSATDLPSFNPILPPAAITQVMLLANPSKEKIRLKYKITYYKESVQLSDVGEIDDFPAN